MSTLPAAVIGVGHLGVHHARVYAEMDGVELVGVVDPDETAGRACADKHGTQYFADVKDLPDNVAIASVVTPTRHHHEVAAALYDRGVHCLVEKPLASTPEQAQDLVDRAKKAGRILQVGHIERFNPSLVAAFSKRGKPRFIDCNRIAPFKFRSQDISVVLDLMIHDIDIILHLVQSPVVDVAANGIPVLTESEDVANARLTFASGCVADVTASRVSIKSERKIRIFQDDSYLSIDLMAKKCAYFTKSEKLKSGEIDVKKLDLAEIGDPTLYILQNLIDMEHLPVVDVEPLKAELESFVNAVQTSTPPLVTGEDGMHAMEVAERITAAVRASRQAFEAGNQ